MAKVISIASLRDERRKGTWERRVPFVLNGKQHEVEFRSVHGEMTALDLAKPIGEMITTDAGRKELLEKVVLDVEIGREQVPVLYGPIYERLQDPNFPEVFDAKWVQHGVVVFMEHMEGEEVKFGHLQAEQGPTARIVTYSAGFEYTEDMIVYNQTFNMELLDRAFGEAYNALLNHIHLNPIFSFSYPSGNKTAVHYVDSEGNPAQDPTKAHPVLSMRETLKAGISDVRAKKRAGTVLLIHGSRENHVQEALAAMHIRGTDFASLTGIETIVAYDGWEVQVGKKKFEYSGVPEDKAYLIRPKRGFKELIKHDLRVDASLSDLSRLVEAQVVGRARRGTYAALVENVQEISLPTFS